MTGGEPPAAEPTLGELREHARLLANDLTGPMRRLTVRSGRSEIEVEWQDAPAASASAGPPLPAGPRIPDVAVTDEVMSAAGTVDAEPLCSPMVGTFYRRPRPDAAPFVAVGDLIEKGQTVGIIEAMKLFNPIAAECSGVIHEIFVADVESVEFGQPLLTVVVDQSYSD